MYAPVTGPTRPSYSTRPRPAPGKHPKWPRQRGCCRGSCACAVGQTRGRGPQATTVLTVRTAQCTRHAACPSAAAAAAARVAGGAPPPPPLFHACLTRLACARSAPVRGHGAWTGQVQDGHDAGWGTAQVERGVSLVRARAPATATGHARCAHRRARAVRGSPPPTWRAWSSVCRFCTRIRSAQRSSVPPSSGTAHTHTSTHRQTRLR
jgi:hypothetical protein